MVWIIVILAALAIICGALALFTALVAGLVEGAVPPIGKTISINGATFHYLDEGSGPAIVLIHGLAGNMRHFTYALKDRLTADHRVILFDRPGCGYSKPAPGASPTLSAQATTIIHFIQALGLDKPLIVGHSLGGAIALAIALDHGDQIGGLALIAPLGHLAEQVPAAFTALVIRSPLRRRLTAWLLATPGSIIGGKATVAHIFSPDRPPDDFGKTAGGFLTMRPESYIAASAELVALEQELPSIEARYGSITCPVSILCGTGDAILDPEVHSGMLARTISGATIDWIENGGHMPPLIVPDRTASFIKEAAHRIVS